MNTEELFSFINSKHIYRFTFSIYIKKNLLFIPSYCLVFIFKYNYSEKNEL